MHLNPSQKYYNGLSGSQYRLSINPYYCVLYSHKPKDPLRQYDKYEPTEEEQKLIELRKANLTIKKSSNNLSITSARKLKKAISYMEVTSKFKVIPSSIVGKKVAFRLAFITLTLPSTQIHKDSEIKKQCLDIFLQALRDKYKVVKYVWRAEIQKNGNIHYHLVIDRFIHHKDIRRLWIKYVNRLGYVDNYYMNTRKHNPPCTEIKAAKSSKMMRAYMAKYLTKTVDTKEKDGAAQGIRIIDGRQYGISRYLMEQKAIVISSLCEEFKAIGRAISKAAEVKLSDKFHSVFMYTEKVYRSIIQYLDRSVTNLDEVVNGYSVNDYFELLQENPSRINIVPNLNGLFKYVDK